VTPLATERQKELLFQMGIDIPFGCTKQEASKLITDWLNNPANDERNIGDQEL